MEDISFSNTNVQIEGVNTPFRHMNVDQLNLQQLAQEVAASRQVITNLVNNLLQAKTIFQAADNQMKQVRQENETCKSLIQRAQTEFTKLVGHDHQLTIALQGFTQENQRLSLTNQRLDKENHDLAVRAIGQEVTEEVRKDKLQAISPKIIQIPSVDS